MAEPAKARLTVCIAAGNSDDKLTQREWSIYCEDIDGALDYAGVAIHFRGFCLPNAPWQSACWWFEVDRHRVGFLRERLAELAAQYRQDSIAWGAIMHTELLSHAEFLSLDEAARRG